MNYHDFKRTFSKLSLVDHGAAPSYGIGHNGPPPVVCDESEGMTLEEQRAFTGEQTPPYPPGRRQDWQDLFDKSAPAVPHPTR